MTRSADGQPAGRVVLEARGLCKSFPGVRAVDDVSMSLVAGEIHGLVGENGAGKSTFVKMLAGAHSPDSGEIVVDGQRAQISTPLAAQALGVAAIYQEPHIVPYLSPVANVFLGQEIPRFGVLRNERAMRKRFRRWGEVLGIDVPATGSAATLSIGMQQSIEIMRALERDARVIVMDEPTAALSHTEIAALHRAIDVLLSRGAAILLISHKLDEVIELSETITVMRDGRKVAETRAADTNVDGLVDAMLGQRFENALERARTGHQRQRQRQTMERGTRLAVDGLTVPGRLANVSLRVGRGEILGVAGLVGAGRTTLLRAVAGLEQSATGTLEIDGRRVNWPSTARRAWDLGIALAPEDRRRQGLVLGRSAADNVVLSSLQTVGRGGFATRRSIRRAADATASRVGFTTSRLAAASGTLSGGNQQKIVLAKCLRAEPRILLVDEPARGIDVGAKAEIFGLIEDLSKQGMGVIIVSEETDELIAFADRIIVLCNGAVATEFAEPSKISADELGRAMFPVEA